MRFDLHIHTNFSDGVASPEKIVKHAKKILDAIAITDHDTTAGLKRAKMIAKKLDFILIPGAEITTQCGDILALGIEEIPKTEDILELIDKIHEQNGLAIVAHPFAGYWPVSFVDLIEILKEKFDAIEVFNASSPLEANIEAMRLMKKTNMIGIAASDAHFLEMIGAAWIETDKIKTGEDILKAIKDNKIKIGWRV